MNHLTTEVKYRLVQDLSIVLFGTSYWPALYYRDVKYQYRMSKAGWDNRIQKANKAMFTISGTGVRASSASDLTAAQKETRLL